MQEEKVFLDDWIKKYDLSPLEIITFSYDIARLSVSNKKKCNEFFSFLLKRYGINAYDYCRHGKRITHHLNAIYIKDDKYKVNGVYFFDLDWSLNSTIDLNNYKLMARTIDYFAEYDKEYGLEDYDICEFSNVADNFLEIAFCDGYNEISNADIDIINTVSEIVDGQSLDLPSTSSNDFFVYDSEDEDIGSRIVSKKDLSSLDNVEPFTYEELDKLYKRINNYDLLLSNEISGETFTKLLFNISKIRYFEGGNVDFNINYFRELFVLSDWSFSPKTETSFLAKSLSPKYKDITPYSVAKKYDISIDIDDYYPDRVENDYLELIDCIFAEVEKETAMKKIDMYFNQINLRTQINNAKNEYKSKTKSKRKGNLRVI